MELELISPTEIAKEKIQSIQDYTLLAVRALANLFRRPLYVADVMQQADSIGVKPANETKRARAFWGMQRTLVQNLVTGVTDGFTKKLLITGVGYRANSQGRKLKLQLGYSHDVDIDVPEGLTVATPDNTTVEISGSDKQKVGQLAAEIRRWRKPEPYKGKGIKYDGEFIFRKEGKKK